MANNLDILDGAGATKTVKSTDNAGVHTTHTNIDSLPASTNTLEVVGDVAHDAAASGNPVLIAGYGSAAAPSDVSADGDATRIWTTVKGAVNVADAGGSLTVDVGTALPAGTNNIGDVDVLSVVPGTAATNLGKAIDTATGGTDTGVLALATRDDALSGLTPAEGDCVQLRTDANGALWVIPSGTLTVGSHAVTNAGTFAVQVDGNALTALQLIDNMTPAIVGPETAGKPTIDSYTSVAISAAANTADQQLVAAPGASKQIWVYGLVGTADTGDGSIALQDEDNTAGSGVMEVSRRGGFAISPSGNFAMPWLKVATNKALEIDTVTCGFKGVLSYAVVSV